MLLTAAGQRNNNAMMAKQIEVEQERKMSTMKRETKATKLRGRKGGSDDAKDKSASAQHLPSPLPSHVFPSLSSLPPKTLRYFCSKTDEPNMFQNDNMNFSLVDFILYFTKLLCSAASVR